MSRLALALIGFVFGTIAEFHSPSPNGTVSFLETFDEDFYDRWTVSTAAEYTGTWGWAAATDAPGSEDKGLVVQDEAHKSAISISLPEPFAFQEGLPLVIQYEVKLQHLLQCGGAYLKLLSAVGAAAEPFDNTAPYVVMFGPDRCGATDRCHFILKYRHPVTGQFEEKAAQQPPTVPADRRTHVYTLAIHANDTFQMFIDTELKVLGHLLDDLQPPINPPAEIDDPTDHKPADWVDEEDMPDPAAVKPEEWDESEPREIPDPDPAVTKPDNWDESIAPEIPDPEAYAPASWDEEEDGVWEPPLVPNPRCPDARCGPWQPPKVPNPRYRGKWVPPSIPNPAYKGPWAPRRIPNPHFFQDAHPVANVEPIHGIGIELWSMQSGMLFDNVLLSHDLDAALEFARATWGPKHARELQQESKSWAVADWVSQYPLALWGSVVSAVVVLPFMLWFLCGRPALGVGGGGDASAPEESADESATDHHSDDEDDEPDSTTMADSMAPPGKAAPPPGVSAEGLHKRVSHRTE